jgi:hypothetical protein
MRLVMLQQRHIDVYFYHEKSHERSVKETTSKLLVWPLDYVQDK